MPPETELIKQQMGQTREALSEKLQSLESKVFGAITCTTETVERTIHDVGATVRETTQNIRGTMSDTVSSVRDAFNVSHHIDRHPWVMLGGSILSGYVGGVLLDHLEHGRLPSLPPAEDFLPRSTVVRERMASEPSVPRRASGFFKSLVDAFAPELEKLKAAAVGMAFGALRDKVGDSVPPQMRDDFTEMMDRLAAKLGGQPVPVGAMYGASEEHDESNGARTARPMA